MGQGSRRLIDCADVNLHYVSLWWLGAAFLDSSEQQDNLTESSGCAQAALFGPFQLIMKDGAEVLISNRRARAMLAMLCLAPDEPIDRDHLSRLLWPGRFEAQAKASLRQCLSDLGKLLAAADCDLLDISRSRIGLKAGAVRTDLSDLHDLLTEGKYLEATERLVSIGAIPLLDQMNYGEAFDDWLSVHRQQAEQRLESAVSVALSALEKVIIFLNMPDYPVFGRCDIPPPKP
ncbi:hypothetical protein [Sphingopyxis sp. BSNA05]|uniref:AfsR/SARP family transcriptional regulator n=1 Tax=Sphingopyxis sp. BSNA05 TaxID=1236614 RepID=UPI0015647FED|nr:hypothetical protein [Sphingopyxis sp. BSNA05]